MKLAKHTIAACLLFLWLNFLIQFFIVNKTVIVGCLLLSIAITSCLFRREQDENFQFKYWYWGLPLLPPIFWQAFKVVFVRDEKVWVWNYSNLGDLPYHLGLSTFLQTTKMWPQNFIFATESLKYPFAVDYLHGLMQHFFSYDFVYPFLSLLFLALSMVIAFHMGGLAFLYLLLCNGNLTQADLSWKNFLLAVLIPQRGYLLALPIGLLLIYRFWRYINDQVDFQRSEIIFYGFIFGSLAWIHLHSFVYFAIFASILFLYRRQKSFFILLSIAACMGLPFVLQSSDFLQKASSIRFLFVWDKKPDQALMTYLFQNFGFLILLPLLLPWVKNKNQRFWLLISFILFALFMVLIFSVWPWDNIKLLCWAYLTFVFVFFKSISSKALRIALVVLLSAPGLYNLYTFTFQKNNAQVIFSLKEINKYEEWFRTQQKDATYIIFPTYNHPIFYYGAKAMMGYDGHLWSHGVNYISIENDLKNIPHFSKDEIKKMAEKYGAKYFVFSAIEKTAYGDLQSLDSFEKSYSYEDLVIYKMY
jgi:hypothetical protein